MNSNEKTATSTAAKQPIPINTILVHQQPHLDEVVAIIILKLYGEALFPGIGNAVVRYVEGDIAGTEADWDKDAILPIGIGEGRFDEHRNGMKGGRIKGECAATLVTKYLDVSDRKELQKLVVETYDGDVNATNTSTQLAELMKVAYRMLKKDSYTVYRVVSTAVRAIINQQRYQFGPAQAELPLKVLWSDALKADEELKGMPRVSSRIGQLIGNSVQNGGELVTEFSSVMQALFRVPYDTETVIMPQFEFYLASLKNDTLEFQAVCEKIKRIEPIEVRVLLHGRQQSLKLLSCQSDELQASKAARGLGNQIVLVRNSSRNFQIFTDKRLFNDQGLSVANLVRMIRWLELPPEKKANADWQELGCAGDHPDVAGVHYHKKAEAIYNGSLTHNAEGSKISTQALIDAIKYAFDPHYTKMWCNQRGITMNPEKVAQIIAQRSNRKQDGGGNKNPAIVAEIEVALDGGNSGEKKEEAAETVAS